MRRKEREVIDDVQIDGIIRKCKICRVGFYDNGEVYIVPLNFGFVHSGNKRIFYFHGAKEGRKFELIRHKPEVISVYYTRLFLPFAITKKHFFLKKEIQRILLYFILLGRYNGGKIAPESRKK